MAADPFAELKDTAGKLLAEKEAKVKQLVDNTRQIAKDEKELAKIEYSIELRCATDKMRLTNDMARKAAAGVEKAENVRAGELESRILEKKLENMGLTRHLEILDANVQICMLLMGRIK